MGPMEMALLGLCLNATCSDGGLNGFNVTNYTIVSNTVTFDKKMMVTNLLQELKGMHLKIATVQNGALSYAVTENNTWVGKGAAFELIHILQKKFKFRYSVILPKENSLGTNKSGIFGLLSTNQADLAAAFLPMTSIYWQLAEFATPLDVGEWVIVLKRPRASDTGSGLLAPFDLSVWLLILVSLLAVGPIMYLVISAQSTFCKNTKNKIISLTDCMWFVYGAILKQGTVLKPASDSSRLVFATWWMFVTVLTAFYTANLTAFLTLSEFTLPIKGPNDVTTQKYPWVTITGSVIEEAAKNKDEELYRLLWHTKGRYVKDFPGEILKTWVTQKNYMYIAEKPNVDIVIYREYLKRNRQDIPEAEKCIYAVTPFSIFKRPRSFAYSKKFKYSSLFDITLSRLVEVGVVKYLLTEELSNVKVCPLNLGNKERKLRNTDLLLTYYITVIGFLIAILIFIMEVLLKFLNEWKIRDEAKNQNRNCGHEFNFGKFAPPSSPLSDGLFFHHTNTPLGKKQVINGRKYWVINSVENDNTILVPIRTPSALLFGYSN